MLKEIIESVSTIPQLCIFHDIQSLTDHFNIPIIRVFVGHKKGEVDHVGSLAKFAIRRYLGTGGKIFNATDCNNFFQDKFKEKSNPSFVIKEITQEALSRLKKYPTINGSD